MFLDILKFELIYRFRRPVVYVFTAMFFLMVFSAIASDSVQMGGSIGNAARNSPFEIVRLLSMMSVLGLLALTGFVATAVNRDYEYRTSEFFYATPAGKGAFLMGRFFGSLIAAMFTVCVAALGIAIAAKMPWLDPERILPFNPVPYLYAVVVFVIPNLFFVGALLFAFATLTRKVLYSYVAMIGFLMLWGVSQAMAGDLNTTLLASLMDPFGKTTLDLATRYWTVVEKNTLLPPLTGRFIANRLLWTGLGAGILVFARARFRMTVGEGVSRRGRPVAVKSGRTTSVAALSQPLPAATLSFTTRARLAQLAHQTRAEIAGIVKSVPFVVIICFGMFNLAGTLFADFDGTDSYPLTRVMISNMDGSFSIFLFIFLLVYAAQIVWHERKAAMHEIHGALPVPDWLPVASKMSALLVVQVLALTAAVLTTIVYQAANGYFNFELGLYFRWVFLMQVPIMFAMAALALSLQVFTNNRLVGWGIMLAFFIFQEVAYVIGLEHNLVMFAELPSAPYSDMNGYGHFVRPLFWFSLYWVLVAGVLVVSSVFFWVRGTDVRGMMRWREARRRRTPLLVATLVTVVLAAVATGGWIFYNTNVLNNYMDSKIESRMSALYEQRYKQYEGLPQPRIADVRLTVDMYPEERRVEVHGELKLVNRTDGVIEELHLLADEHLELTRVNLPDESLTLNDEEFGYRIYKLPEPLEPGEGMALSYDGSIVNRGFMNGYTNMRVVENGTFLATEHVVPHIGYSNSLELQTEHERKKHDLPPKEEWRSPDDPVGLANTMTSDADWVTFEATLSTSADQTAITVGYLENEWEKDGRRYFHYVMDEPTLHFYPFMSGRYVVARERWNDVEIAVYHHPGHKWNVDRMIESVSKSLEYYTEAYGPYQHRQVSIVEFPRYHRFAQSFSTIIPYSEDAHFVNDLRDEDNLDMVYYITAHEVAHQWWGHQVCAAWVKGATFMEESFAQYSALMVMEQDYGPEKMEKFLSYELDRYLRGRSQERKEETPLLLADEQSYLYYQKGSLVTYALRDYIGEERLNAALRDFIERNRYVGPPYPNVLDLVETLREATPDEYDYLIEDMIETITLYDNRADEASLEDLGDGTYRVTMTVQSRKMRADGRGVETEVPQDDWIEIGVYGEEGSDGERPFLYLDKHKFAGGTHEIEIVVDERPVRAGIDPRHLFIDRVPDDNIRKVSG
ncbi:MAG: M1 family aminopeptidase [Candidatus Eisenbacteria bacterium]